MPFRLRLPIPGPPHLAGRAVVRTLVLALAAALSLGAADAPARVRLQLKWRHQFQFAGYYVAQEKGYFREAGLDVDLLEAGPGVDPIAVVCSGTAEYGIGNSSLLLARQAGQPVVALATLMQHSPLVLAVRAHPGLHKLQDLAGRRIMLEPRSEELLAYFRKEGLDLGRLQLLPHSFDSHDLLEGRVDACSAYLTDEPFFLQQAGLPYLIFTPRAAGIDFYGDTLFTSESELRQHPGRVAAFRAASLRGWRYAMEHAEEAVDLIARRYGSWHSRDHLRFEAREMATLMQPDLIQLGYMNPDRWRQIADTYADLGQLPRGFNLQGFLYDPEAGERRLQQLMKVALSVVLPALAILGVLAAVFLHLNRRLRKAVGAQAALAATLADSERRFRFIAEHSADVMWTLDPLTERFTYVSPSIQQLRGYTPEEVMAQPPDAALTPESALKMREVLYRALEAWRAGEPVPPQVTEVVQQHKDGHLVYTEIVTTLHPDPEGHSLSILGVTRDITERKRAENALRQEVESLEQLASTDLLTGAWNRRRFQESLDAEIHRARRYGHPLTMIMLDIDHFKRVNDTHGHAEGDRVLRGVADRVRSVVRLSDSLTRWGGEEFIVLMPNTGLASATALAERIREAVAAQPFGVSGTVTVSLGLAEFVPSSGRGDWMDRADRALYRAKGRGRNRVEVDVDRDAAVPSTESVGTSFLRLVWHEGYRSGNATIDAQHEHLFRLANELLDAVLAARPDDEIAVLVSTLLQEVVRHFQDEERILSDLHYGGLWEHAGLHAGLVSRGFELDQAFRAGRLSVGDLFHFLAHEVVAQHMLKADREFFHLTQGA